MVSLLLFFSSIHDGVISFLCWQRHHATVTVIHAYTENPEQITSEADIVVSAAGVPNLVRGNWIKTGATVIDVGTSPVEVSCELQLEMAFHILLAAY